MKAPTLLIRQEKNIYSDRFIFKWLETGGFKQMMSRVGAFNKQREEEIQEEIQEDIAEEEATEDGTDSCG